jgi:hypothetical protein
MIRYRILFIHHKNDYCLVTAHRVMDLPSKTPYQWRNEYPTKKPRMRQELVGEIAASILLPALAGVVTIGAKPVVFTVKV